MQKKYHYLWISGFGGKLRFIAGDTDRMGQFVHEEATRQYTPGPKSGKRLNRALRDIQPDSVFLHEEGPSITYFIERSPRRPAPAHSQSMAIAA